MEKDAKKCKYFSECGACVYLNEPYEKQLRKKTNGVKKAFLNEGIETEVKDTIGMYYPYAYRNKIHLTVKKGGVRNNQIKIGFFEEDSDNIVDVENCLLHDIWAEKLIKIVRNYVEGYNIEPYDKETGAGILRYVAARYIENSILVTLVVSSQNFPGKYEFYDALKKEFKNAGLYLNINKRTDNAVFDKTFIHKAGLKFLEGKLNGVKFSLHPASFFQINSNMAAKIYKQAADLANGENGNGLKNSRILDLYSGIGITSVLFAQNGALVTAVESVKQAVLAAIENAKINGVQNKITVICGACENVLTNEDKSDLNDNTQKTVKKSDSFDTVFLDPARMGCNEAVITSILSIAPKKIIYLSCNPITLARDIKLILNSDKYEITFVQPYDLFPHTEHVETLVCLRLK